jgi:predicted permease
MTSGSRLFARALIWLHERSLHETEREAIVGDLLEGFEARAARDGRAAARWLWAQTWRSLVPNVHRRFFIGHSSPAIAPARGGRMLNGLSTDFRFALRVMWRQPVMSIVGIVSLGAGLAFNIVLVTLADAVLVRPLPLRAPHDLALVLLQRETGLNHNFSYAEYRDLRDNARTIDGLVAYSPVEATVAGRDAASTLDGEAVSGTFFSALGVPLRTGRAIVETDDRGGTLPVVVVSERVWRDRLDGAPLSDRILQINGQTFTVVGVASARFAGMQIGRRADFWVPLAHSPLLGDDNLSRPTVSWLTVVGRLASGVSMTAARDELDAILRRVRAASRIPMEPVVLRTGARGDSFLSEQLGSPILILLGAGIAVLLVASLNVANLHLARSDARRLELSVRAALGARRTQLVRLVLLDAALTAIGAGLVGLWLALLTKDRAVSLIAFYGQPVSLSIPFDARVIAAAVLLSAVAALIVGLLSAWQVLRPQALASFGDGRAATTLRRTPQRALVVLQVALSMGLVTGAVLLARTLDRLRHTDLGFDPRGVVVVQVSPEMARMSRPQATQYFDRAVARAAALPGVETAAVAHVMPLDFGGSRMSLDVAGYTPGRDEDMELNFVRVTPEYFRTMGLSLLQGRVFDRNDRAGQPTRIVVNETMARRFWPDGRAAGGFVRFDSRDPFNVEVIGVVRDAHYRMVREDPRPSFYVPIAQVPASNGVLHVRYQPDAAADLGTRIDELRRAVGSVDPAVPVTRVHTLLDQIERNIADERMATAVGFSLAAVAVILATAGLYATMAFFVGRRTREIGVRMALGARHGEVRALVVREGLTLAIAGVAAGLALSAWVGHALSNQLYGIASMDPVSLVASGAILVAAAAAASWLPAAHAARVDPVVALREP